MHPDESKNMAPISENANKTKNLGSTTVVKSNVNMMNETSEVDRGGNVNMTIKRIYFLIQKINHYALRQKSIFSLI